MEKALILTILFIGIALSACKSEKEEPITPTTDFPEREVLGNKTNCYLFSNGKDSIRMTFQIHENEINGWLNYDFFEKDGSIGEIEGEISGDTLKLEFEFLAEGTISKQQVYFLNKEDKLFRGNGEMRIGRDSMMVYTNTKKLNFDDSSPLSLLNECANGFINPGDKKFYMEARRNKN